ncbi:hypothetical protein BDZ94DRAFT_1243867 [Collybia nuda]|uniref:Uncharacterized protein n=1 Tax=Collybia nuda TaxID=64659 RepID=A0A9P6CK41_9AGAR|nr:hypothetical protein BDZ94DRAFT_1243867 [Collybia nuda]
MAIHKVINPLNSEHSGTRIYTGLACDAVMSYGLWFVAIAVVDSGKYGHVVSFAAFGFSQTMTAYLSWFYPSHWPCLRLPMTDVHSKTSCRTANRIVLLVYYSW